MRTAIPEFSRLTAPLHKLMESSYKLANSRRKTAVSKVQLGEMWCQEHTDSFKRLKRQLASSVELVHPKPNFRVCLFTDASDTHWSAILTQSPISQNRKPVEEQENEPLAFISGSFKGHSENWSVPGKEGFAIVEAMDRLNHLVSGKTVSIYTDHANLLYIFDPLGSSPSIPRHTASKLTRWAIKLSTYRFEIEHVAGEKNVLADLLTRWAVQPSDTIRCGIGIRRLLLSTINPSIHQEYDWPSMEQISSSQENQSKKPKNVSRSTNLWRTISGKVWIPESDHLLQLRILIAAHTGRSGHRLSTTTYTNISKYFTWEGIEADTFNFVNSCLHCCASSSNTAVSRPLGHSLHAARPNELIHFDYCYMGRGEGDFTCTLIIKDDLSGYVWFKPCEHADSETTAEKLTEWFSSFGIVTKWISDQGSHFKNEVIRKLGNFLRVNHHFTLPYCPWYNGTVEVVCRELSRTTRALLYEFQLPPSAWPSVLPLVQSALNSAPSKKLNNHRPLTVFSGLPSVSPILAIVRKEDGVSTVKDIEFEKSNALIDLENLREKLSVMHRDCAESSNKKRKASVDSHNRRTGVRKINFDVGDFVLKGLLQRHLGPKTSLRW